MTSEFWNAKENIAKVRDLVRTAYPEFQLSEIYFQEDEDSPDELSGAFVVEIEKSEDPVDPGVFPNLLGAFNDWLFSLGFEPDVRLELRFADDQKVHLKAVS